jgi:hypothetical protein
MSQPGADEGTAQSRWLMQLHCERVLGTLLQACDEAAIDVLPVKGIVSARTLYADVSERTLTDIDVRVRRRDLTRIVALARRHGFQLGAGTRSYGNATLFVDGRPIDVESHFGAPGVSRVSVETVMARATRTRGVFPFSCLIADPHDHALLLVMNAYKDHMSQAMAWAIRDLERVVRAPWFERDILFSRAAEAGVRTMLWIVADWMAREMLDDAWAELRAAIGNPPRPHFIAMHQRLQGATGRGELALRVLSRFGSDAPAQWLRAGAKMAGWQAEAWLSQLGDRPYSRGVVVPARTRR